MANKTLFNEEEFEALDYLPHLAVMIYFKAIRPYMDYSTGITGWKRGISLRQMAEETEVETAQGRHASKSGKPSIDSIRNAIQRLEVAGLLEKIPADKKLVFRLPLATVNYSAKNMNPTRTPQMSTESVPQAEVAEILAFEQFRNDMNTIASEPMSTTHQESGSYINTTTTSEAKKTASCGGGDFSLIFDNKLTETERKAIKGALPDIDQETAQQLVDELAGVMLTQEIKSHVSYFNGLVRRFNKGEFVPTAGIIISERRAINEKQRKEAEKRRIQAAIPKEERTSSKAVKEGREAMRLAIGKGSRKDD